MVTVSPVEEQCPVCGGEDIGCPFGDWTWGDDDVVAEATTTVTAATTATA